MDPWLEHPSISPDVHNSLIIAIRDELVPKVAPKYFVGVEPRTYVSRPGGALFIGRPDVGVGRTAADDFGAAALEAEPSTAVGVLELDVEVPVTDRVEEWYLEVHETATHKVVTVLELLSLTNKLRKDGREQYLKKRDHVLDTQPSLIEIDLLRSGKRMPIALGRPVRSDYRILVSRGDSRPRAKLYAFGVRRPIPQIPIPLLPGDPEPGLDLNTILHALYERARFDLRLNYRNPPMPPLREHHREWAREIISKSMDL
jgi:hypothetical protein